MTIGVRVRVRREAMGLIQQDLGDLVGVGPNQIGRIESGRTESSYRFFTGLAAALNASMDWLSMGGDSKSTVSLVSKSYARAHLDRILDNLDEHLLEISTAPAEAM